MRKRPLVYKGPVGTCPCCDRKTEVHLGGVLGYPSTTQWVVPTGVLEAMYSAIIPRIKEKEGTLYVTSPNKYDGTKRSKLYFVNMGDKVMGPYGERGLKVFLGVHFGDQYTENIPIYIVNTTHRALQIIKNSPFGNPPEEPDKLIEPLDLF